MRKILWIGLAASESVYQDLLKKGYFHFAAQEAQNSFITGIEENLRESVDMISGFMMPTYTITKELITKSYTWTSKYGGTGKSVDNLNIKYLDVVYRTIQMKKKCREWAYKYAEEDVIVFVYSAVNAYIQAALEVKKICKKAKVYLIITDLPQFMELRPSFVKKVLKTLDWKSLNKAIHNCDGWIVFTKHMISYLDLPEEKCLVVEGTVDIKNVSLISESEDGDKVIIMYSGSLGLQYGIPELLDAFSEIEDKNYELWFTGKGNAESLINERVNQDARIKCFGFLKSHATLLSLQSKATMLVNMRMPTEKASAYCFPSKIFDYMLSGKPVLSFKIPGIPDEYYQYLVMIKSTNIKDIRDAIIKVGNMTKEQRKLIGMSARNFIVQNKNKLVQTYKICKFTNLLDD